MKKINTAKILGYAVTLFGLLSVVGWVLGIDWLKDLLPYADHMEFLPAAGFVPAGIVLILITKIFANEDRFGIITIILPMFSLMLLLLMAVLFFSVVIDTDHHITGEVIQEAMMRPGMAMGIGVTGEIEFVSPLVVMMLGFILIALSGLFVIININGKEKILLLFSVFVMSIGAFALIGYSVNFVMVYYQYNFFGRILPFITFDAALLFILWGLGMMLCCLRGKNG